MLRNASSKAILSKSRVFAHQKLPIVADRGFFLCYRLRATAPCTAYTPLHRNLHQKTACQGRDYGIDTIYALSTAAGRAGIAIVRISGPSCLLIYNALCPSKPALKPRYASVRTIYHPLNTSNVLDSDALLLYLPGPKSVTGEDVLELHIHGGPATVKAVLSAISECPSPSSIRYAEPGEFTRRAFENNRLDLAQVEALSDTLSAETEQQRRAAVRGNSGKLGKTYETWRQQLLYARGELEALIDFSEDQHFDESPAELLSSVSEQVTVMLQSIAAHRSGSHRGELIKKGIRISLLGPPNAGKSSLLNQIVGREASIVSQEAGTTRDVVEVSLDIRGYLCTFADTAGLRSHPTGRDALIGNVEMEGIRRAKIKAAESDLVIAMASMERTAKVVRAGEQGGDGLRLRYNRETLELAAKAPAALIVINKSDYMTEQGIREFQYPEDFVNAVCGASIGEGTPIITLSCKKPDAVTEFVDTLAKKFKEMTHLPTDAEDLLGVTERQRQLLSSCHDHLKAFLNEAKAQPEDDGGADADIVLAAEHLRSAANCLSRITGRGEAGDVEEVLGVVFEKFVPQGAPPEFKVSS